MFVAGLVLHTPPKWLSFGAPPTQDTGRCCTEMFIGVYRLVVFAELMVIWSWLWLLLECVCWWLVYPGCHDCSCTPGLQPHPARVQLVWLRPGEAVNQPSTTHTLQTPSTMLFSFFLLIDPHGRRYTRSSHTPDRRPAGGVRHLCHRRATALRTWYLYKNRLYIMIYWEK